MAEGQVQGDTVESVLGRIYANMGKFRAEAGLALKPNKAAGVRARKLSLELDKDLMLYRKLSVGSK